MHPSGPNPIAELNFNVGKIDGAYKLPGGTLFLFSDNQYYAYENGQVRFLHNFISNEIMFYKISIKDLRHLLYHPGIYDFVGIANYTRLSLNFILNKP